MWASSNAPGSVQTESKEREKVRPNRMNNTKNLRNTIEYPKIKVLIKPVSNVFTYPAIFQRPVQVCCLSESLYDKIDHQA